MKKQSQWILLAATSSVSFMSTLDASIVNIAIPHISRQLGVPMNEAEWVVSVYLVLICTLLIFFGRLSDQIGRIPIFQTGTLVFLAGSLLCGLSNSLAILLIARGVQALGSSMVMATNFGIITEIFPTSQHGRALGINSSFVQVGNIAGPGLGGLILGLANWHWIFFVNLPIGVIAFLFGHHIFKHEPVTFKNVQVDWRGYATFATLIPAFFIAIYWGQAAGFNHLGVISLLTLAAVLLGLFIWIEQHVAEPLIQLRIFNNRGFSLGIISAMLVYMVGFFNNVIMPFYLQETLALSAGIAGIILMAVPLLNIFSAPIGGIISDHIGAERISFYALFIFFIPELIFIFIQPSWSLIWLVFGLAMFGVANGAFQNNPMIMGNAGKEFQGIAGAIAALSRNLGMTFGLSLATSLLYFGIGIKAHHRMTAYPKLHPDWFIFGMHFSYVFALGLIGIAIGLMSWLLWSRKKAV
ncbi:MFS transporter [Furfurilactobacillus siliginis]|uniref:MFS transporter n=1 Tax=Furfurilactobacillus siliginis TaxID=348151 RepID=A0A0R2L5T5_9LACO|nr:MFS transporter [Furfurilactobacillus siliginis]KRN97118.1 transporter, major facilitator family protein [Furfurilactobacillus siliginis]GEK29630.1 MFS transporter [Furfurilactobacillus siliginis]